MVKARQLWPVRMVSNEGHYRFFLPSRGHFLEMIESQRPVKPIVKMDELLRKPNAYKVLREQSPRLPATGERPTTNYPGADWREEVKRVREQCIGWISNPFPWKERGLTSEAI
jgi:hypothetical protein